MQPKISSFFKRQATQPDPNSGDEVHGQESATATEAEGRPKNCSGGELRSKKRTYAQFHLELGQSDFVLHTCSVCGMMYARGNDDDEKVHKAYHKSYFEGVLFKGWRNETVIAKSQGGDRVILVTDEDSRMRNNKVQEVIKLMEKELGFGEGQFLHKLCKVYLYISCQRIVGCLVTEPIKTAHKVIPCSAEESSSDFPPNNIKSEKNDHTLEFGKISFRREIVRRHNHSDKDKEECRDPGAIICEEEAVPAICGFRAIWVVPSRRRKRIGSKLMDVARFSCLGNSLFSVMHYMSFRTKEKFLQRPDVGDLPVCFYPTNLLRKGTSMPLLQGHCILSIQKQRCIIFLYMKADPFCCSNIVPRQQK